MRTFKLLLAPLALLPLACESEPIVHETESIFTIGGLRPATLIRPLDYVAGTAIPVVIMLHGYNSHSGAINRYFRLFTRIGARVRASGGWPGSGRDWLHSSRRFGVRRLCA